MFRHTWLIQLMALLFVCVGTCLAGVPLFQGELDITNMTLYVTNKSYNIKGSFTDRSVAGFDGTMISTGDLTWVETGDGSCDPYAVTNIVSAEAVNVDLDIEYYPSGGTSTYGVVIGIAAICTLSTNDVGYPQPPSSTGARVSKHMLNEIRNYSFRLIAEGTNNAPLDSFISVSNDVAIIKTNYYPLQSGLDGSNALAIVLTNYTELPTFASHANNESVNILHVTAAEKLLATNSIQGMTIVTGAVASVTTNGGIAAITVPSGGGAGTMTNLLSTDGSITISDPGGPQPDLSVTTNGLTEAEIKAIEGLMTNSYDIAIGISANGANSGVAIGISANGDTSGVAVGREAVGAQGVAVGFGANGVLDGIAIGRDANGASAGIAIGRGANGLGGGAALGAYSYAIPNSVALGANVSNSVNNSTLVKGKLYVTNGISMSGDNFDLNGRAITNGGSVYFTNGAFSGTLKLNGNAVSTNSGVGDFLADGSVPMTGDLPMGGQSVTNVDDVIGTGIVAGVNPHWTLSVGTETAYADSTETSLKYDTVTESNSCVFTAASGRVAPQVEGRYRMSASGVISVPADASFKLMRFNLRKNGTAYSQVDLPGRNASGTYRFNISGEHTANGSTDYFDVAIRNYTGLTITNSVNANLLFSGSLTGK